MRLKQAGVRLGLGLGLGLGLAVLSVGLRAQGVARATPAADTPVVQPGAVPAGAEVVTGGRFTFVAMPGDLGLARNLLDHATANDTFPGLPRPSWPATIMIASDDEQFREWIGVRFPEWGIAVAFPGEQRIVMHGRTAGSRAGDPRVTLRHELAHLSLHEFTGSLPPRWFDEGYASYSAREWGRDEVLASSVVLALRGVPRLAALDTLITGGSTRAERGYALAHRAVADLAALDQARGLTLFFGYWIESRSLDNAVRAAFGITLSGFEDSWRRTTRRRYGAIAILADFGFAIVVLFLIAGPLWLSRRRRDRARLAAMVAADALTERRERESALAVFLGDGLQGPETPTEQTDANEVQIKGR
ncbi:MAG: hypothetical protein O2973_10240 [Gemmatimonadetes bacterium]|nr:hypothetical protein [Gemmatimonadota bacterium]